MKNSFELLAVRLNLFDGNPNTNVTTDNTTGNDLSPEMKTYYEKRLIDLAEAELIHDQFAQVRNIPKNGGKTIEFRQFDPLPEAKTPLTEGVTPDGQSMNVKAITATVQQYGGYVTLSDILDLTAIDNNIEEATKMIASQGGRTMDGITRDIINAGTAVQYADGKVASRKALYYTSATDNCNLNVDAIKRAVRTLENQDAPKINGYYVGIIHPNCKYDLMKDPDWKAPHQYADTMEIYKNEIGELHGVRFVQSSRAMVFKGAGAGEVKDSSGNVTTPGQDVYSTLILGDNAYGTTSIEGGGLQHIVKPMGSAGTADPLNQRSTVGWKGLKTAEILVQQYMVRIETTASK